jgi:cobalt-zinc-cadmium efflux system membrane fusion protein
MRPVTALVAGLIGAALLAGGYRLLKPSADTRAIAQEATSEPAPQLVHEGQRIRIPENSPLRSKLVVAPVTEKEITRTLVLPAVVEADPARLIKVSPPLSGRITQLKVQLGERIEVGQPLVVIDSPDLGSAYADYDRAKVLLSFALKNRDRQRDLAKIGGGSIKDMQQAETDYVTAEVESQRSEDRLKQIGVPVDSTTKSQLVTITAPFAGSVIDLAASPGVYWNDPTAALMTIADLSTVWVTANVPEKDTTAIAKGQKVDVVFPAYPGETFKSTVLFVSDVLDPDTRRTKVRIAFDNPDIRLKPNMFADVSFVTPAQTMAAVPTTALVMKDDGERAFVEVAPWTFEPRPVDTGFQQGDQAIIKSGLKSGERIVVKGGVLLND